MKIALRILFVVLLLALLNTGKTYASSLINASDAITTSRPSPSSPLSANAAAGAASLSIFANSSRFLASDSAKVIRTGTGIVTNVNLSVASQSADLTTVYLNSTLGTGAGAGADVLFYPITAMHTITFTTVTSIPSGGDILISFPGTGSNAASPSATMFAFNNLSTSNIQQNNVTGGCTFTVIGSNQIRCVTGGIVGAGTTVTILVGCSSASGASCTTQVPTLINPTKSANAGTADIWKIHVQTRDAGAVVLDDSTLSIGTIDSVTLRANVDPSLSFTIAGIGNNTAVNNGNNAGGTCDQSELTNTGIAATATEVNLGTLANTPTVTDTKLGNISAQLITISTNAANGYVLTATSSGHLKNPATGYFLNDNTTPTTFPSSGANYFGMHACGLDTYSSGIGTTFWNTTASNTNCNSYITGSTGNICKYGWPTSTSPITVASDTSGPIGNALVTGNGLTSVSYAGGADAGVPPGQYTTVITYVATPAF